MVTAETYTRKQTARARRKDASAQTSESAESLKNDLSDFRQRLSELASAGADEGVVAVQQMYERLHSTFEDVMNRPEFANAWEKTQQTAESTRETVRQRPLQMLAAAAGAGVLLGYLMRR